jgi:hypothetical protein
MASTADPWLLFNRKLEEFASDLSITYGDIKDFKMLKNSIRLAVMMTPKVPQAIFHQYVYVPYETQIIEKDEAFFMAEDYDDKLASAHANINLDIVHKIKTIWKSLAEDQKEIIWKYMQVLVVLNRRCLHASK